MDKYSTNFEKSNKKNMQQIRNKYSDLRAKETVIAETFGEREARLWQLT